MAGRNHSTRVTEIWHKPQQILSSMKTDTVGFLHVLSLIRLTFIHAVQHFLKSNERVSIIKENQSTGFLMLKTLSIEVASVRVVSLNFL